MSKLVPESDSGSIEYKWRLINLTSNRVDQLITQMKYRLQEGKGECTYEIGIADNGELIGLDSNEMDESLKNLESISQNLQATIVLISRKTINSNKEIAEVIIREDNPSEFIDIKIAVSGSANCGKSTILGVLTSGITDNGRGSAREHIFNHPHEIETGRTSSVGCHIIGYNNKGGIVNNKSKIKQMSWANIIRQSNKVISFFDLAGHEKYLKTTITGLSGMYPDYALILVGANMKTTPMTEEHIKTCIILKIPYIILISKIDIAPKHILKETMMDIKKLIKMPGARKIPYLVKNEDDLITSLKNIKIGNVVPIIQFSSVTGDNLNLIKSLLNYLPSRTDYNKVKNDPAVYTISESFKVEGVGVVFHGLLLSGQFKINDNVLFGPDKFGKFKSSKIKSIECKKVSVTEVSAGYHVCLVLSGIKKDDTVRGQVIISADTEPIATREFEATIYIFKGHSTTIKEGYEPTLHIGNIRQSCKIVKILNNEKILRSGNKADVVFRFKFRPEYLIDSKVKFLFNEGKTRGAGIITKKL